jgi:hypothetical protein
MLLLNVVAPGTEEIVLGNKVFVFLCQKKSAVCELSHIRTRSINSSLLLKGCDLSQFLCSSLCERT